jgi:hypothetical protein
MYSQYLCPRHIFIQLGRKLHTSSKARLEVEARSPKPRQIFLKKPATQRP